MAGPGRAARRHHRAGGRRRPARRHRDRGQAGEPLDGGLRRRAHGRGQHVAELRRWLAAVDRPAENDRRQPGSAVRVALQLRPVPALRRRDRADRGRRHGRRHASPARRAEAGVRAGRGRGHGGAPGAVERALGRQAGGGHRLRLEHRPRELSRSCSSSRHEAGSGRSRAARFAAAYRLSLRACSAGRGPAGGGRRRRS